MLYLFEGRRMTGATSEANTRVLFVDDNENILNSMSRQFRKLFAVQTCTSPQKALELIKSSKPFAVVVSDMKMPEMDGIDFLSELKKIAPKTNRVMLTGNADQNVAISAVNEGEIFQFLRKPCDPATLQQVLQAGIDRFNLSLRERELLEDTLSGVGTILSDFVSLLDTSGHARGETMRATMKSILSQFNVLDTWEYELAALLSNIGYCLLPTEIRAKIETGQDLNSAETALAERHPEMAFTLLRRIPRLNAVGEIILYQKKNFDGSGFPRNDLKEELIPLGGRILRVLVDLHRSHSDGETYRELLEELTAGAGTLYDPEVLEAAQAAASFLPSLPESPQGPSTGELAPSALEQPAVEMAFSEPMSLKVEDLKAGQIVLTDIHASTGTLLIPAGNALSDVSVERIRNYAQFTGVKEPIVVVERLHGQGATDETGE